MSAVFGPAGNSNAFYEAGLKASVQMPGYLEKIGLDAYEYQCGKGVNISAQTARSLGLKAKEHGIRLSLHAPYYINLANPDEQKRENTIGYIIASLRAAQEMGADRIVVHSGALMKMTRREALDVALVTMRTAVEAADAEGFSDIHICPETMGKINQLGDLDEVIELCRVDDRLLPVIDFGHLNARTLGGIKTGEDYAYILDKIENGLGRDRLNVFHSHFSKIEYTKGGEKRHLTFADDLFGPEFEPLAELIAKKSLSPVFICESDGTQTDDALSMKKMYRSFLGEGI